ncbi:neuraminidase-like domain-containing protein [Bordetella sp. LUAb4]|uniref:Tc toxin subunit A-related protein n=1 Tax=Bordetella sp. LUAb4 TaxID=2843195 RepID=UPI001E632437|nr:neuraminidase-like domain-containing protein [Bordetella sp. LUAb4]
MNHTVSALQVLEQRCHQQPGTLAASGIKSLAGIVRMRKAAFVAKYHDKLGGKMQASLVYRHALSILRLARSLKEAPPVCGQFDATAAATTDGTTDPNEFPATWINQFGDGGPYAEAGSLGAQDAPVAYATMLYDLATELETEFGNKYEDDEPHHDKHGYAIPLAKRRPDIAKIALTTVSESQVIPKLTLVNQVLQQGIDSYLTGTLGHAPDSLTSEEFTARIAFPADKLPYHAAYDQMRQACDAKHVALFDLLYATDAGFPSVGPLWSAGKSEVNAEVQAAELDPALIMVLESQAASDPDAGAEAADEETYLGRFYGNSSSYQLNDVATLSTSLGVSQDRIKEMLCVNGIGNNSAVTLTQSVAWSPAITAATAYSNNQHYGARYLCADGTLCLLDLKTDTGETTRLAQKPSETPSTGSAVPFAGFAKIHRLMRLHSATGLPFDQIDALIIAAAGGTKPSNPPAATLNDNTYRLLGLYKRWNQRYGATVEDICSFAFQLELGAVGNATPQFDRIFNSTPGAVPLVIDATKSFDPSKAADGIVVALCAALKVDYATFSAVAAGLPNTGGKIALSLATYTALFNLTKIPNYLGISPLAFSELLQRVPTLAHTSATWSMLANLQTNGVRIGTPPDLIMCLRHVEYVLDLLRQRGIPLAAYLATTALYYDESTPLPSPTAATQKEVELVNSVISQSQPTRVNVTELLRILPLRQQDYAGVTIDWQKVVNDTGLVDKHGLITLEYEEDRQAAFHKALDSYLWVSGQNPKSNTDPAAIANMDAASLPLRQAFDNAHQQQWQVTDEVLQQALGLDSTELMHQIVQTWADLDANALTDPPTVIGGVTVDNTHRPGASYKFLFTCDALNDGEPITDAGQIEGSASLLYQLGIFARLALVAITHRLTPAAVEATKFRETTGERHLRNWFGFIPRTGIDSLYVLTPGAFLIFCAYGTWRELADSEDAVLEYLADANLRITEKQLDQAAQRVAEQIGASATDILVAVPWTNGNTGKLLLTVAQMLQVLKLLSTAARAGLSALQLLSLDDLDAKATDNVALDIAADSAYTAWSEAAANLLASVGVKPDTRLSPPAPADLSMDVVQATLAQHKRTGLCGAWQSFIARQIYQEDDLNLTQQEISEYLLIDTQVTQDVDTSVLADAIASLQLYINNIFNATEPGYEGVHWAQLGFAGVLDDWQNINAQYSTWAANIELGEYPENYLAPPLRPDQTEGFKTFCTTLQQGPIDDESVLAALQTYLSDFERFANLTVISGYMDALNAGQSDEYVYLSGMVHLIGKTATEPSLYFMRHVDLRESDENGVAMTDDQGYPLTDSWSGWQEVSILNDAGQIVGIPRVAIHNSRPSICWFERQVIEDSEQDRYFEQNNVYVHTGESPKNAIINPTIKLIGYVSFQLLDGTWSTPQQVASAEGTTYTQNSLFYYFKESDGKDIVEPQYWTMAFEHRPSADLPPVLYSVLYTDAKQAKKPDDPDDAWHYSLVGTLDAFDDANTIDEATVPADYWDEFAGTTGLTPDEKKLVTNQSLTGQSRIQAGAEGNGKLTNGDTQVVVDDFPILQSGFLGATPQQLPPLLAETPERGKSDNVLCCNNKTATFIYKPGLSLHGSSGNPSSTKYYSRGYTFQKPGLIEEGYWTVDFSDPNPHKWTGTLYIKLASNCGFTFHKPDLSGIGSVRPERYWPQLYFPDFKQYQWYTEKFYVYSGLELKVDLIFYLNSVVITSTPESARNGNFWGNYLIRFSDNASKTPDPNAGTLLDPSTLNATVQTSGYGALAGNTDNQHHYLIDADGGTSDAINFNSKYTPVISLGNYLQQANWQDGKGNKLTGNSSSYTTTELTPDMTFTMSVKYTGPGANMYVGILETDDKGNNPKLVWRGDFFREASFLALKDNHYPFLDSNPGDPDFGTAQMLNMLDNTRGVNSKKTFPLIRLNTTFARMLVQQAAKGLPLLYSWDTQSAYEPKLKPSDTVQPQIDYEGANSIYFWEIFFHCPAMAAYLLSTKGEHAHALTWLQRIFDPRERNQLATLLVRDANGELHPKEVAPYWKSEPVTPTRPLSPQRAPDTEISSVHPFTLAYADPVHYRKWTYMQYIRTLTAIGDEFYRHLTRDGVNQAYQCYARALTLLGPRLFHSISRFPPGLSLADVKIDFKEAVDEELLAHGIPRTSGSPAVLSQANSSIKWSETFQPTTNTQLEALWDVLDARLYNIRHNLDINGTPMRLPLYALPADPNDLLLRVVGAGSAGGVMAADTMPVPPYRYQAIAGLAEKAVSTLSGLSNMLLGFRASQDGHHQEQLQMSQLIQLWSFTDKASQQSIDIAKATLKSLKESLRANEEQQKYYEQKVSEGDSVLEIMGLTTLALAGATKIAGQGVNMAMVAPEMLPNVFGMATGGSKYSAPLGALLSAAMITSEAYEVTSQALFQQANYHRRDDEWQNMLKNYKDTAKVTQAQIDAQEIQLEAARTSRQLAQAQHKQNLEMYNFLQHRFTNEALYSWLASKIAPLQYQAYDAALSLCLLAQSCWRNEVADWNSTFFHNGTWNSRYQGLLSGEPLTLALQQMQTLWYSSRHARRLEIVKTVSVKALMASGAFDKAKAPDGSTNSKTFAFNLTQKMFDLDYPGHYLRQITSVAVSLPAAVGPLQNVRAIVQQTGSCIVTDMNGDLGPVLGASQNLTAATGVRIDSSARQSTVLSTGISDSGVLSGDDGRYLPFETTGAVSSWIITFPYSNTQKTDADRPQNDLDQDTVLASLNDIIVTLTYTATDSGRASDVGTYWKGHL